MKEENYKLFRIENLETREILYYPLNREKFLSGFLEILELYPDFLNNLKIYKIKSLTRSMSKEDILSDLPRTIIKQKFIGENIVNKLNKEDNK